MGIEGLLRGGWQGSIECCAVGVVGGLLLNLKIEVVAAGCVEMTQPRSHWRDTSTLVLTYTPSLNNNFPNGTK